MDGHDLLAPTCDFFGGPWDGRRHYYTILAVEFYVPDSPDCATLGLTNTEIMYSSVNLYPVHVYKRGDIAVRGSTAHARYFYRGIR